MANSYRRQIIVDGPRNVVVLASGVLDTADIGVAGQIGASGFTTNIGSPNVAFVAGALAPMVGQYLTFGDGTTTFPAGTYIVSITDATHIVVSNNALANNAAAAVTITGVAGGMVLLDPAVLIGMDNTGLIKAKELSLLKVVFTVEDGLEVRLSWDATTPVIFDILTGRTKTDYHDISGLPPPLPALAGANGRILLSTEGWSGVKSFTVTVYCKKLGT